MNGALVSAFQANGGIAPSAMATALVGAVFAAFSYGAYGPTERPTRVWSESRLNWRRFLGVVRFPAMRLMLTFFLLS